MFLSTTAYLAAFAMGMMPLASCFTTPTLSISTTLPRSSSSLSAHNNDRRDFLRTITTSAAAGTAAVILLPSVAEATAGASSNIVMPNYIEYLIEKNAEGLAKTDMLYKGPDPEIQLRRIGEASNRLPEIAQLAEDKKWSQVQGIITGPLGTLLQTMNSVASLAGTKGAKDAAKLVKTDLLEIGAAAGRKDSATCVKNADKAAKDLEKFVKVAFQ